MRMDTSARLFPPSASRKRSSPWTRRARRFFRSSRLLSVTSTSLIPITFRSSVLVAEEVEKVNPDLVARDEQGKAYTVRYEAVNAMLLNEFLKEHRQVQEQQATIGQLKSHDAKQEATIAQQQQEIKALAASLKEQALQIQRVSAQLAMTKPVRAARRQRIELGTRKSGKIGGRRRVLERRSPRRAPACLVPAFNSESFREGTNAATASYLFSSDYD